MKVFVGYGYNERDQWIEDDVLPILRAMGFTVFHGKDMHGEVLQDGVKRLIEQCEGLIGFCTLRKGQEQAEFNTHPWVRDEIVYALALNKPILEVREDGVNNPFGIVGDRQRIALTEQGRFRCIRELISLVVHWNVRRIRLGPKERAETAIRNALNADGFKVSYRTRMDDIDSIDFPTVLEKITGGLYLNARVPPTALIQITGRLGDRKIFQTDWESVDAVQVAVR